MTGRCFRDAASIIWARWLTDVSEMLPPSSGLDDWPTFLRCCLHHLGEVIDLCFGDAASIILARWLTYVSEMLPPSSGLDDWPLFLRCLLPPSLLSDAWLMFHRCLKFPSSGYDDGGSKYLWNVGIFIRYYTAQQPRRQSSSTVTTASVFNFSSTTGS
jgi:hypothetical protein